MHSSRFCPDGTTLPDLPPVILTVSANYINSITTTKFKNINKLESQSQEMAVIQQFGHQNSAIQGAPDNVWLHFLQHLSNVPLSTRPSSAIKNMRSSDKIRLTIYT